MSISKKSHADSVDIPVSVALATVVAKLGGSHREGQVEMAEAVHQSIRSKRHLLVEAGTGTGKSLGYLVPAVLHASHGVREDGSGRAIIATATIALQRQLFEFDLPAAVKALAADLKQVPSYALLKGRHNYICLERFHRAPTDEEEDPDSLIPIPASTLAKQAKKLRAWVEKTSTGDRDDFEGQLDARIWRANSVNGRECIGASKCAWGQECFAERAKQEAHSADIVVTNHALLAIDILENMPVLPERDLVIIDEAHELVDRTTNVLAGSLDDRAIERAAGLARKYVDPSTHTRLLDASAALANALQEIPTRGTTSRLDSISGPLLLALTLVRDVCRVAQSEISASSSDEPEVAVGKQRARAAIKDVFDTAAEVLGSNEKDVTWLDVSRAPVLHHAPLSVAGFLRENLFAKDTVVMTSATLQVAGSMESTAASFGLNSDTPWQALNVGSPFDYSKQGILYCAAHLPAPTSEGVVEEALDELADLIDAAGGRTLSLFSSWRGVERAAEYLELRFRGRDDRPLIIAQRGDSVAELVEQFKATPHASLLGTVSLWQGIDVPGDTCTLVTIDRIPFPRPDEPVMAARAARVDEAGGSGFRSVSLPRAALLLAQGVGRLIRTVEDRGVVAVLDSRLANSGYGGLLRKSLPPLWWTTEQKTVIAALTRLDQDAQAKVSE